MVLLELSACSVSFCIGSYALSTMWKTATRLLFSLGSLPLSSQRSSAGAPFPDDIAARVYWQPISFAETAVTIMAPRPGTPPPSTAEPSGNATANSLAPRSAAHLTWTKKGSRPLPHRFQYPHRKPGRRGWLTPVLPHHRSCGSASGGSVIKEMCLCLGLLIRNSSAVLPFTFGFQPTRKLCDCVGSIFRNHSFQ
mgnify:CR=1 FL=1